MPAISASSEGFRPGNNGVRGHVWIISLFSGGGYVSRGDTGYECKV